MPGAETAVLTRTAEATVTDMECLQSAVSGDYRSSVETAESLARLDARVRALKSRSSFFSGIELSEYAQAAQA